MNFLLRMSELARTLDHSPGRALELAESLEEDIVAGASVDPTHLGWARDYRIRSLYRLGRHEEALALLTTPSTRPISISIKNTAWLYGLGAEMAVHIGAKRQVVLLIGKALDLRIIDADPIHVRAAVEAGFALLLGAGDLAALDTWYAEVEARAAAAEPPAVAAALRDSLAEVAGSVWFKAMSPNARRRRAVRTADFAGEVDAVA